VSHLAPGFDGACYRFLPKHAMADVASMGRSLSPPPTRRAGKSKNAVCQHSSIQYFQYYGHEKRALIWINPMPRSALGNKTNVFE
jgi:hypothetical protein